VRTVLITGIPRSGTTLAGALVDSLPDTVCLSEPPWHWHKATGGKLDIGPDPDGSNFAKWLVGDCVSLRNRLLAGDAVLDRRTASGRPLTNYHQATDGNATPERTQIGTSGFSASGLSPDFTLAIKHNGPYLTALGPLLDLAWFTIIALVRNPVDTLHSWRSLDLPVSRGKMHDAARCWPEMAAATAQGDVLQRQVMIYDLICQRLHAYRERVHIIQYEALQAEPGILCQVLGVLDRLDRTIVGKPSRQVSADERAVIVTALERFGKHFRVFYPDP
jgi:hypothetical protein